MLVQGAAVVAPSWSRSPAVTAGRIEPVWLAVVALLPLALFDVLAGLPASALAYQRLRGSAVRIQEVETTPSPVADPARSDRRCRDEFAGLRRSRGVTAHWTAAIRRHRRDRPGRSPPGERVAVVGPSGSGKSTLAAVLMGFLPYAGSVRLSGVEVRDADGDDVRQHVGMLTQQAHIFDTTVADNVRIGDPDATDDEVAAALDAAQLDRLGRGPARRRRRPRWARSA